MESRNDRRLSCAKLTEEVLTNNTAATAGIPDMPAKLAGLNAKILIVDSNLILAGDPSTGVTINVKSIRETMILSTYRCAKALVNFASDTPVNEILRSQAKVTLSGLRGMKKQDCGLKCEAIVDLALANAAGILPKGVTATDITDAQNLVTLFNEDKLSPEEKIQLKKAKNKIAVDTLDDIMLDYLPNSVDTLVDNLIISDKDFYDLYYQSRRINHVGQGTTRITYTVMQGTSPVNAATASIINKMVLKKPRTKPYPVQTSTPEGIIIHNKLGTGLFDITISKEEFLDKVLLNNRVKLGDSLDLGIIQFTLAPKSGILLPAEIRNLFSPDSPFWTVGQKIQVKNTTQPNPMESPIVFYPAQKPNDAYSGNNGETLTNGQEVSIIISISDLPAYINVTNLGTLPATFEIKFM